MTRWACGWTVGLAFLASSCSGEGAKSADERFADLSAGVALPEGDWPTIRGSHSTWKQLAERELELRDKLERRPGPVAWAELGGVYALAEEYELALPFLVEALRAAETQAVGPEAATAWAWLGVRQLGVGDDAGARAFSERALELEAGASIAQFTLARIALAAGDAEAALPALREAHRLEPANVEAALELGSLLEERDQLEPAARVLSATLQTDRTHPGVLWRLARVRRAQGADLEAEALEQRHARAIRLDDLGLRDPGLDRDEVALALGRELLIAGEPELARVEFLAVGNRTSQMNQLIEATAGEARTLAALDRSSELQDALARLAELDAEHPALTELGAFPEESR